MTKSIRWRIYTEHVNHIVTSKVLEKFGRMFESFTSYTGPVGYWKGAGESTLILEVITPYEGRSVDVPDEQQVHLMAVRKAAAMIKKELAQEAVLITRDVIESELV